MGVKVATTCLQWSHPIVNQSHTLASVVSSPCSSSLRRRSLVYKSSMFGTTRLYRSRSFEYHRSQVQTIRRACSASLDDFNDEEFSKKIQELALRFQLLGENTQESQVIPDSGSRDGSSLSNGVKFDSVEPPWLEIPQEPPIIPASIERKANSVDLPLSLRMIKRKLQWQEGVKEVGETACCSVKRAFSSMVFIIRELHSFTLQMRERLLYEDLQGIIGRVQKEMQDSFVWLFQQVFSQTPTLMVYLMVLLANFTVHSMASNLAFAMPPPTTEVAAVVEIEEQNQPTFDSTTIKSFSISSNGKTASIGNNNGGGGGGRPRPIASGTDGEGRFDGTDQFRAIIPNGASELSTTGNLGEAESVSNEDEVAIWNRIVDEAAEMQSATRGESLDHETTKHFVSPVRVKIEDDDYADHLRTELLYQVGLSQDPNNPLLLANYAQFLYLVAHDLDRAEEYFKKAIKVEPPDAEAYSKYAHFLWQGKKDLWAAEETFLEAISADPSNSYYAANYAHFLWNTGGEDTCFPLSSTDEQINDTQEA